MQCLTVIGWLCVCVATQSLDGEPIKRAERLRAGQDLETLKRRVLEQEAEQLQKREREKREGRKDNTPTINNG